jgi:hypothetical protein
LIGDVIKKRIEGKEIGSEIKIETRIEMGIEIGKEIRIEARIKIRKGKKLVIETRTGGIGIGMEIEIEKEAEIGIEKRAIETRTGRELEKRQQTNIETTKTEIGEKKIRTKIRSAKSIVTTKVHRRVRMRVETKSTSTRN